MVTSLARERAAQAWCKETTKHKEMDVDLAEAFAEILDEIWSKPWLMQPPPPEAQREGDKEVLGT